jgi:DNA-binding XRE family transcriptional regulator
MNFELFEEVDSYLEKGKIKEAIKLCESKMQKLDNTYFHPILGQDLLHQTEGLTHWIDGFYQSVSKKIQVQALYAEMNGFDVNTDVWYVDGFAYQQAGTTEDLEWLADWNTDTATEEPFTLTGFEPLQEAFEQYLEEEDTNENLETARDIAEVLVIVRLQELIAEVHKNAKKKGLDWQGIPLLATAHGYETIYESK